MTHELLCHVRHHHHHHQQQHPPLKCHDCFSHMIYMCVMFLHLSTLCRISDRWRVMTKLLLPPVSGLLTQPMDEDESQHWISPGLFCTLHIYSVVYLYIVDYSCIYKL